MVVTIVLLFSDAILVSYRYLVGYRQANNLYTARNVGGQWL